MKWSYYPQELIEASHKAKETKDCTVKAWVNVFDCSYDKARNYLRQFGRFPRKGMKISQIEQALKSCKKAKVKIGPYSNENKISLTKFCQKHPVGRYYVIVRGHALCVKDGMVIDHSRSPRRQVKFACRVYLDGEL